MVPTVRQFKLVIGSYYRQHGRDLPWRRTHNPYKIMVSEIMLQQTRVDRVVPYYKAFLKKFPTVRTLARAELSDVLRVWQGLGYNRRGKALHDAAKLLLQQHNGKVPKSRAELEALPGIGPYTAGAIRSFAWSIPEVFIETNIRTVYTHHFFPRRREMHDTELLPFIEKTLDTKRPREWCWALMDYGAHLKRSGVQINAKSRHYKKQSRFAGSNRQLRGQILKLALASKKPLSEKEIARRFGAPRIHRKVGKVLRELRGEGLIG